MAKRDNAKRDSMRSRMSLGQVVLCASVTLAASSALANEQGGHIAGSAPVAAPSEDPVLGISADAGIPDGVMASLVIHPLEWLRLNGGVGHNSVSMGFRGGVTLLPFGSGPSLSAEVGRYLEGDANGTISKFAGESSELSPVFEKFGYDFANVHLGVDIGRRYVTFYLHAGLSYVRANVRNLDEVIESETGDVGDPEGGSTTVRINGDPTVRAFIPSVKLGLIAYLF